MRLSRIETFMLGRILMYDLNAVTDAHIADAIIRHLKRGELLLEGGEVGTRAENFIRLAEQFDPPGEHLLSIAYTLGHLNGMADHIYARVAERRIFTERGKPIGEFLAQHTPTRQTAPYDYQGGREKVSNVMALAQIIWRGRFDALHAFGEKHSLPTSKSAREVAWMIALVQRQNMISNRQVARALLSGAETKVQKVLDIRRAASAVAHPAVFIRAAASTQRAAALWDGAVAAMIRARYGV